MSEPFGERSHDTDADHLVESPDSLRDDDPEAPPMDRGSEAADRPLGSEKFGTTHEEADQGESLDQRLSEERPDDEHDPVDDVVADQPGAFGEVAEETDEDVLEDAYSDQAGPEGTETPESVGRLVEPDEGAHTDTEKDVVARDVGRDGGGESAEEAALHAEDER